MCWWLCISAWKKQRRTCMPLVPQLTLDFNALLMKKPPRNSRVMFLIEIYLDNFLFATWRIITIHLLFLLVPFIGLPGVLWVLPDSYIDVKNKDYGGYFIKFTLIYHVYTILPLDNIVAKYVYFLILGDKYINGEIIPSKYPTYQPKRSGGSKSDGGRRYERRRDGPPPAEGQKRRQEAAASDSSSTWGSQFHSLFHSGCYWSSLSLFVMWYTS